MVRIFCGWCNKSFNENIWIDKHGDHTLLICPHCARVLPASRKVIINSVGKQHIHEEWKDGDVAI